MSQTLSLGVERGLASETITDSVIVLGSWWLLQLHNV